MAGLSLTMQNLHRNRIEFNSTLLTIMLLSLRHLNLIYVLFQSRWKRVVDKIQENSPNFLINWEKQTSWLLRRLKEWDTTVVYNFLLMRIIIFPTCKCNLSRSVGANNNGKSYLLLNYQRHSLAWLCWWRLLAVFQGEHLDPCWCSQRRLGKGQLILNTQRLLL